MKETGNKLMCESVYQHLLAKCGSYCHGSSICNSYFIHEYLFTSSDQLYPHGLVKSAVEVLFASGRHCCYRAVCKPILQAITQLPITKSGQLL
ncbi:hypothetical protein KY289_001265 [Solanum tuberosum]|nr:hypothetical protein KY289_001265 [Solanum tuberosum]